MTIDIRRPLAFSEIGAKDNQEDSINPSLDQLTEMCRFFILCDGMGGHDSGEVASETVCLALGRYFEEYTITSGVVTVEYFQHALEYAYDELDKKDTDAVKKMGTTMACLYLHRGGYLVAHIGDSRIYHIRPSNTDLANNRLGIIYQSSDHSLVNDLLRAGELTKDDAMELAFEMYISDNLNADSSYINQLLGIKERLDIALSKLQRRRCRYETAAKSYKDRLLVPSTIQKIKREQQRDKANLSHLRNIIGQFKLVLEPNIKKAIKYIDKKLNNMR